MQGTKAWKRAPAFIPAFFASVGATQAPTRRRTNNPSRYTELDRGIFYAFERKQMVTQATAWMGLEDVMLSDIKQA